MVHIATLMVNAHWLVSEKQRPCVRYKHGLYEMMEKEASDRDAYSSMDLEDRQLPPNWARST